MVNSILSNRPETVDVLVVDAAAGRRLHALDGLRGWAALAVVIHHLVLIPLGIYVPETESLIPQALANGQLAVMIFFVMSGIALTLPFWNKPVVETIERLFYARYLRLTLPILFACIVANLAVGLLGNSVPMAADLLGNSVYSNFHQQYQSWTSIAAYSTFYVYTSPFHNTPIAFLWTMRTEMAGSIAIFALLFAFLRVKQPAAIMALVFILTFSMNMFIACFFAGALIGYLHQKGVFRNAASNDRWSLLSPLLVIASMVSLRALKVNGIGAMQIDMLAAILIVTISISSRSISKFLGFAVSRFLGEVSFPLYLTHYVFLVTVMPMAIIALDNHDLLNKATAIGATMASVLLALVFAALCTPVERLAVSVSRRFAARMIRIRKASGIGTFRIDAQTAP